MAESMHCEVVTPARSLFNADDASFVVFPGIEGEMGVYAMHTPIITTLRPGIVKVIEGEGGKETSIAVSGGYAEVDGESVLILAHRALLVEEIDVDLARESISRHESELAALPEDDPGRSYIEGKLTWVKYLVEAAKK